jgi:uncharacterized damage-inducible protein DinB
MDERELFYVTPRRGFTPEIGRLVSMLEYARHTTILAVRDLTVAELDYLHDEESNSIGALLSHIAAVETWYQANTFFQRELTQDEERVWNAALDLGDAARREIRSREGTEYVAALERARRMTLEELARRDDAWLEEESDFGNRRANNYFKWFHVLEDELSHRGQIRWLKKRAIHACRGRETDA